MSNTMENVNTDSESANVNSSSVVEDDFDLDLLEQELFSEKPKAAEKEPVSTNDKEKDEDNGKETTSNDEDVEEEETETASDSEESEEESESSEEPNQPKAKKESRAEKRIRALIAEKKELERLLREKELAELEEKKASSSNEVKKPNSDNEDKAPHWDDLDEDGKPKYPLGQFDPKFNADLVKYTIQQETKRLEQERQEQARRQKIEEAERALERKWEKDLSDALERYPDFQQKGQALVDQFQDLEPNYAKFLTDTIRSLDNGADVFYYLASSPEEAKEIVAKGPSIAAVYLGRISAKLEPDEEPTQPNSSVTTRKVTNAPKPPPRVKGTGVPKVRDLDDLDELERALWGRGR